MAISQKIRIETTETAGSKALKLVRLTGSGRAYLKVGKAVPKKMWAEIDQTVDEMIKLMPPDEWGK